MANYYVSTKMGNDKNAKATINAPLKTLKATENLNLKPGDTVYIMDGVYENSNPSDYVLKISKSGTAGAPITYRAYPGQHPVIKVRNYVGIQVLGSFVTIDGLEIVGNQSEFANAKEVLVKQNADGRFSSPVTSGTGIQIGSFYEGVFPDHVRISNNIIHDHPGSGVAAMRSDYVTVENNIIYQNGYYSPYATSGISFYQSRNSDNNTTSYKTIVRGNTIYGNRNFIPNYINLAQGEPDSAATITDGNGIIIDDNAQTQFSSTQAPYQGKTLIENNNIYNNGGAGINVSNSSNVDIKNNTLTHNLQSLGIGEGEVSVIVSRDGNLRGAGQGVTIANNKISPIPGNTTEWRNGFETDANGTTRYGTKLTGGAGGDILTADPNLGNYCFNQLFGEDGNDILTGSTDADYNHLFGGAGDDILNSGGTLNSGGKVSDARYNYLVGGTGNDLLNLDTAKAVLDVVIYNNGDGQDTITNFSRANVYYADQIHFNGIPNIDVVSNVRLGRTEFRVGNGIRGGAGFGKGDLMVTLKGTVGFGTEDIGQHLFGSNFAFS
jgi:parallel beta-helix repeat protein